MNNIIKWVKQNNEDMGIVYMLYMIPFYIILGGVLPVITSVCIGYGVFCLLT